MATDSFLAKLERERKPQSAGSPVAGETDHGVCLSAKCECIGAYHSAALI
jgi:hypothetical protein